MTNDERAMNRIVQVFGIGLTVLGALAVWRAVFFLIPFAGLRYGLFMALFACLFTAIGIVMTVISTRKAKKWKMLLAEQAEEQAAQAEQTDETE